MDACGRVRPWQVTSTEVFCHFLSPQTESTGWWHRQKNHKRWLPRNVWEGRHKQEVALQSSHRRCSDPEDQRRQLCMHTTYNPDGNDNFNGNLGCPRSQENFSRFSVVSGYYRLLDCLRNASIHSYILKESSELWSKQTQNRYISKDTRSFLRGSFVEIWTWGSYFECPT